MDLEPRHTRIVPENFDMSEVVRRLLPQGHVVHGYSSANSTRLMMVLESRDYSDKAPLLGFGADGTAERAFGRTLLTYAMREQEGLDHITERHYPESTQSPIPNGRNSSVFDLIVWGGGIKIYQEGDEVVAWSEYSNEGYMSQPVQAEGHDALSAMDALANAWRRPDGRFNHLPTLSFE